ncbi:MAG: 3-deoxy-D-manno-octulosonic acid transferase [Candidatus Binataceae bacterium]
MVRTLYNLLWYPATPVAIAAARTANRNDLRERLGRGEPLPANSTPRIWIHAASVGEVEAIRPIAAGLLERHPQATLIITTMTVSGRDAARRRITNARAWRLAPFDSLAAVRAFLARTNPDLVLVAETELWPNYFFESMRRGVRVAIVNGRMSERSMRRYRRARGLFGAALGCASLILAQSGEDARRFRELHGSAKIIVTGNTKLGNDSASEPPSRSELLSFAGGRRLFVAGATAPGEEAIVLAAYRDLRARFPGLALAIAPRHIERAGEIERLMRAESIEYCKASAMPDGATGASADVLILDTMGELRGLYRRAAIAFVGGSLTPGRGGQSPAEAAAAGVPILIGPHHENHTEIVAALVEAGGARIVKEAREIADESAQWLGNEPGRAAAGDAARETIRRHGGGARRALEEIELLLGDK